MEKNKKEWEKNEFSWYFWHVLSWNNHQTWKKTHKKIKNYSDKDDNDNSDNHKLWEKYA